MTTPLLHVEDVRRTYGRGQNRFDALKGVSFDIREGESVAILGKSGSGKSTLMHILALLDAPTSGVITLDGVDTRTLRGARLNRTRNKTFGFVFQQFFLNANSTVLENVILPMKIAGIGAAERKRRGLAALEQLELADKAKNKASDLSGGKDTLENNVRLFMIPGMDHCGIQPGPGGIGQDRLDLITPIEAWVEEGTAPDTILKP